MTLHQDIIRTQVEHDCDPVQAMVILWQQGIAPEHRKAASNWPNLMRGTETLKARAAEQFKAVVDAVMPHHDAGMTVQQIRAATGYCENTIRKAIRSQGQEPHRLGPTGVAVKDISPILPKVKHLRSEGASWRDIGKRFGVDRDRLKREFVAKYGADT